MNAINVFASFMLLEFDAFQILSPELMTADHVYQHTNQFNQSSDLISLDKKLRAVFLRLFASLFSGYRSCLTITRIHPQPVIHFNRTLYLLLRGNSAQNEFYDRLLSSMRFHQFILERGPPFRVCDLFDEEYELSGSNYSPLINTLSMNSRDYEYDMFNQSLITGSNSGLIERLSTKLFDNECGDQPVTHILPDEAVEAHKRIHQTPFPVLDAKLIDELTVQYSQKKTKNAIYHKPEPRFVPQGQQLDRQIFKAEMFPDKYRVIHEFVEDIFNQHITEALKRRNTIRQDLKSRPMRRLFVDELRSYLIPETSQSPAEAINNFIDDNMTIDRSVYDKRAVLTWEQFELIVDLLDEALRQETQSKDSGITPIIMDLSTRLCTELENVRYYANMSHQIQRHDIWRHMPFWESIFNEQVNNQIRLLYIDFCEEQESRKQQQVNQHHTSSPSLSSDGRNQFKNSSEKDYKSIIIVERSGDNHKSMVSVQQRSYTPNMSALEIAAEEMRVGYMRPREVQQSLETREESTVYAQIIHFINLIINFRIPVHIGAAVANIYSDESQNNDGFTDKSSCFEQNGLMSKGFNQTMPNNTSHKQQCARTTASSDIPPVTSQINNALKLISQNEGLVKNTGRYYTENYSNNLLSTQGLYSTQNIDKSNTVTLLNHITALENWLSKFVKNVGEENNLLPKRITEIESKIKAIIESHLVNLQAIYPRVQNIPHMKKPEIANPVLLPGEIAIPIGGYDCLSCQLLPDGRYERNDYQLLDPFTANISSNGGGSSNSNVSHGNDVNVFNDNINKQDSLGNIEAGDIEVDLMLRPLLPAQGALFVTNYRLIFTGVPKDPFQSNKVINRSFPISALSTIKKLGCIQMVTAFQSSTNPGSLTAVTSVSNFRSATLFFGKKSRENTMHGKSTSPRYLSPSLRSPYSTSTTTTNRRGIIYRTENLDVLLLRSLTFQMLKIGFDVGEIQPETRDELRSLLEELRYPSMICMGFNSAPLGLLFSRSPNVLSNRTLLSDLHSNLHSTTVKSNKEYMPVNRMRHVKGKAHRSIVLADTNYSSLMMNGDRRYLRFRRTQNQQFVNSTDNKAGVFQSSSRSATSIHHTQWNCTTSVPFLNCVLTEEAATNLVLSLKSFLVPPSISASSTAATVIDPSLIKLFTQSSGYLDMARFACNLNFNSESSTSATMTQNLVNSVTVGSNEGTGSLNRSSVGAGSSGGSRVFCAAHLVAFNVHHSLVKSYPSFFIIPLGITQNCLSKVAHSHKRGRFPVVTWQHPETKAYLLRGSEIQSNVILNTFKNFKASSRNYSGDFDDNTDSTLSHTTVSKEHIRYIRALIDMSLSAINSSRPSSVITSETGYSAVDDLSTSSQLPIGSNPIVTTYNNSPKVPPTPNHISIDHKPPFGNKTNPNISSSNVTANNKTKSLGRIGMFAARRRLSRSGLSPMTGSVASGLDEDLISVDSASHLTNIQPHSNNNITRQSICDTNCTTTSTTVGPGSSNSGIIANSQKLIGLYVLCEKQMTKISKIFNSSSILLLPIEYPTASTVTKCFKGFFKACLPNDSHRSKTGTKILSAAANTAGVPFDHNTISTSNNHGNNFTTLGSHFTHHHNEHHSVNNLNGEHIETDNVTASTVTTSNHSKYMNVFTEAHENGWFIQLKSLLELAGTVVDLLDLQGASVALCLENGSDVVAQTVSLVQIMLDPYYRTIAGFWSLIDKEWLIFGHTFNQNLGQTLSTKSNNISPIFLQFLDAVHQLLRQFPLAFEFNDYYLRFIAYHHVSNRFHNFKYDSELERFTVWFPNLVESLANNCKFGTSIVSNLDEHALELYRSRSIWPFIQQQHYEWPVFFNFRYSRTLGEKVLRPATNLASFDLWQFYLTEDLACGSIYDLDHFSPSYRKNTNRPYEPVLRQGFNNSHIEQTYAVLGLREGEEAIGWQVTWEQAQSELLNHYSSISSPPHPITTRHNKTSVNKQSTSKFPKTTVSTSTTSVTSITASINDITTNTHVKLLNKFNHLPSRFTQFRESSEPAESISHRELITSDSLVSRRRSVSSSLLLDINQTKIGLLPSTTISSTKYPPTNELTQTLTPQGESSDAVDLDDTYLNGSGNITTSSVQISERNSLTDATPSRVIIVKDPLMKGDSHSQPNGDMNTTSTTITVRTVKDSNSSKTEEIAKANPDKASGIETKHLHTTNKTTYSNPANAVVETAYNCNDLPVSDQISEDEAFHEEIDYTYGDRYDSVGESSVDDYQFARHAILEYHRTATLKRLTRRTGVVSVSGSNNPGLSNGQNHMMFDYTLDVDLTPGYRDHMTIGYESDSVNSFCGRGSSMIHDAIRVDGIDINAPVQEDQLHLHKFTPSQITNNANVLCELCQTMCQSSDNVVKCSKCDLLCHAKCSTLDSKCFRTLITNTSNQINKTGNLLKRHGSEYLPSGMDSGKLSQSNDVEKSSGFGVIGSGGNLFSPTLPWRTERDHSFRSSLILIQDKRGKRKLSESSSSLAHTNTLSDTQSQSGRSLSGTDLPKHLTTVSYYGYLYKLGHRKFLQQWKQRFFALDINRHQLKYYESYANASPRGCIDLQDVRTVRIVKNFTQQRKSPTFVVFELETNNRTYKLGAVNQESAMQWIERIQQTIQ
ncbi:Myotubularin-related protein [Schistosoma japonicum]|uniref:Myotubularin-related protein n=1 Tax=Schistosoma japonicum TaxID=6182 RepID=A0A4Z2CUQ1_SCHJA|nr:Myotubularin-related protein [Schistosoma japonicum]